VKFVFVLILFLSACQNLQRDQGYGYISLAPHCTEIIYSINAQDKLLAVTDFCTYPPEAGNKQSVGGLLNPNIEKIIGLHPDLLFGLPAHQELAMKLEPYSYKIKMYPNETLDQILMTIDSLGFYTNKVKEAAKLVTAIKDSLTRYKVYSENDLSALLIIGRDQNDLRNIMIAGPQTFLSEIWENSGGKNAFHDLQANYAVVSRESILLKDPDLIIELRSEISPDGKNRLIEDWKNWSELKAVKEKNVFVLSGDYCMIPGPRVHLLARGFFDIIQAKN